MRGQFGYGDAYGGRIAGTQRLICEMTLRSGEIAWDWNARAGEDYRKLSPTYGIRPGIDQIIRPEVAFWRTSRSVFESEHRRTGPRPSSCLRRRTGQAPCISA